MVRLGFAVFVLALAAAASACDSSTEPGTGTTSLNITADSLALTVGETKTLAVIVTGTSIQPTFSSSNPGVVTVSASGAVHGETAGVAYVRASLGSAHDSVKVVVVAATGAGQLPLLGTGTVTERWTAEVASAGQYAYTTTWNTRAAAGNAVKVWDVSGNTPVLMDSLIVSGAGTTSDVQISADGKYLVVSTEAGTGPRGIAIFDRSVTPAKPSLVKMYSSENTTQGVHTVKLSRINGRDYAFLQIDPGATPAKLVITDITNPAAPVDVFAQNMGAPFVHDVFVRDGILFAALWNDGMSIFDIGGAGRGGSPSSPVLMSNVRTAACPGCTGSEVHNIWWFNDPVTGSKKYAFIGEEGPAVIGAWSRGDIHVVDVSDFSNPREVAFFRPDSASTSTGVNPAGTHNFDMDESSGILYAAYYNGGVRALDVRGDLSACTAAQKSTDGRCNLRLMGREVGIGLTAFPTFVWGVKVNGNFLYASDMPNGIHKLSIAALKR